MQTPTFKPLLFTTTMRNPSRMKGLLNILSRYNAQLLTNELTIEILGEIIRYGLYRPNNSTAEIIAKWGSKKISEQSVIGNFLLSDTEVSYILNNNTQTHKEAGFDWGWPSRFATIFDFPKELGFVYFNIGETIYFSELGLMLANSVSIQEENGQINLIVEDPLIEQSVFCQAMAKYQRKNPFVRVLNDNVPLILLLQVIRLINQDPELNGCGISRLELPLIIFWKNNNAEEIYYRIKSLRQTYGYNPSWEIIIDICLNEIMEGNMKVIKEKSIMNEYPDEFIRKMRLTGLISLRGAGRFIDINLDQIDKVDYIIENYSNYESYDSEKEYFDYMAEIDTALIALPVSTNAATYNRYLDSWLETYNWSIIKIELINLADKKRSQDEVLRLLTHPVRLEFLTALAIRCKFQNVVVRPNYPCDDTGLPTSTASGGIGDIECEENYNGVLVEVTMAEGRSQTIAEVWPISRHLVNFKENYENAMCHFIAPSIFIDSQRQINYVNSTEHLIIKSHSINDFISFLENANYLYSIS